MSFKSVILSQFSLVGERGDRGGFAVLNPFCHARVDLPVQGFPSSVPSVPGGPLFLSTAAGVEYPALPVVRRCPDGYESGPLWFRSSVGTVEHALPKSLRVNA